LDHDHEVDLHRSIGCGHAGEEPVHELLVRKAQVVFLDELVLPEDAVRGRHQEMVRPRADEHLAVERAQRHLAPVVTGTWLS
jgi:hypothetical protein